MDGFKKYFEERIDLADVFLLNSIKDFVCG